MYDVGKLVATLLKLLFGHTPTPSGVGDGPLVVGPK